METLLEQLLGRWLPDWADRAELSAHVGWSLAVPALVCALAPAWVYVAGGAWIAYGAAKELLEDGHWRALAGEDRPGGTEPSTWAARAVPAALVMVLAGLVG